jgi:hypothetical protein
MSQPFGNIFGTIMRAKRLSSYADRLGDGTHQLILKTYKTKQSDPAKGAAGMGTILESEFLIAKSTNAALKEGDSRGWPWFIEGKGWAATYAQDNAKQFIEAIMRSIDLAELPKNAAGLIINPLNGLTFPQTDEFGMPIIDRATGQVAMKIEHDTMTVGELLAMGYFRGVFIAGIVSPAINKKTGQQITDSKGKPVSNAEWRPVPGQTLASIAELRAYLDTIDPPAEVPQQPNHQQTQQVGGQVQQIQVTTPPPAQLVAPAPVQSIASAPTQSGPLGSVLDRLRNKGA